MRGIILAAGQRIAAERHGGRQAEVPAARRRHDAASTRQIDALRAAGIDDIAVVVGCQAETVRRICGRAHHLHREHPLRADQQPVLAVAGTTSAV